MSQYFKFTDSTYNTEYIFTDEEVANRLERIHLSGHYRYHFEWDYFDKVKNYKFHGVSWTQSYLDNFISFESDDINDLYERLYDFILSIEHNFPLVLSDNAESTRFFGATMTRDGHFDRGEIRIGDYANNTCVSLQWNDILKMYHLKKLFGLLNQNDLEVQGEESEDENNEKEEN